MGVVFWDIKPCDCSKNRRFGGTYRLHLRDNETLESFPTRSEDMPRDGRRREPLATAPSQLCLSLPWSYCCCAVASSMYVLIGLHIEGQNVGSKELPSEMGCRVALVRTDVSEKHIASIFREKKTLHCSN
jgi:hypothetical protein